LEVQWQWITAVPRFYNEGGFTEGGPSQRGLGNGIPPMGYRDKAPVAGLRSGGRSFQKQNVKLIYSV